MKTCKKCQNRKPLKDFIQSSHVYCFECFGKAHKINLNITQEKEKKRFEDSKIKRISAGEAFSKSLEKLEKGECEWTEVWSQMIRIDACDYNILYDRTYSKAQLSDILTG